MTAGMPVVVSVTSPCRGHCTIELVTDGLQLKRKISPEEFYSSDFLPKR